MATKTNFRSRVMKQAYQLWLATKESWSMCMKKAWSLWRLAKLMRETVVGFAYKKADGTWRNAYGTLRFLPEGVKFSGKGKPSYKTFTYFDCEKNEFRCFRIENLLTWF